VKVHEQLRQVPLRIDLVPLAGAGDARENGRGVPASLIPDEQ
jgi:hypothetical protein